MADPAPALPPGHLVLVGLMGVGKSTVGALVAERCGRRFVDLDQEVERRAGATVREVFDHSGEAEFRALETAALAELFAADDDLVVATGGGIVLDPANRVLLHDGSVAVWLRAAPRGLAERITDDTARPLLDAADGDVVGVLERLAAERDPLYRSVAAATIDTDGLEPDEVAAKIVSLAVSIGGAP